MRHSKGEVSALRYCHKLKMFRRLVRVRRPHHTSPLWKTKGGPLPESAVTACREREADVQVAGFVVEVEHQPAAEHT